MKLQGEKPTRLLGDLTPDLQDQRGQPFNHFLHRWTGIEDQGDQKLYCRFMANPAGREGFSLIVPAQNTLITGQLMGWTSY